jgi:antitoxin (DNA-binding transcriptional repressor) of toxin-antitoxin stability system
MGLKWFQEAPMSTVNAYALKDELSSYLQRAESCEQIVGLRDGRPVAALVPLSQLQEVTEQQRLADLESRGLVMLPRRAERTAFQGTTVPNRGKLASEMVSEDRR